MQALDYEKHFLPPGITIHHVPNINMVRINLWRNRDYRQHCRHRDYDSQHCHLVSDQI